MYALVSIFFIVLITVVLNFGENTELTFIESYIDQHVNFSTHLANSSHQQLSFQNLLALTVFVKDSRTTSDFSLHYAWL